MLEALESAEWKCHLVEGNDFREGGNGFDMTITLSLAAILRSGCPGRRCGAFAAAIWKRKSVTKIRSKQNRRCENECDSQSNGQVQAI
jgi:hypothetical protein